MCCLTPTRCGRPIPTEATSTAAPPRAFNAFASRRPVPSVRCRNSSSRASSAAPSQPTAAYDGYYPGIHLTYNITDNLLARFSYAKTIGRPDYANIVPATDINYDDSNPSTGTITIRNSALKPWTADNFDFSLEYYFKKGGLLSGRVFQKNLTDFWNVKTGAIDQALADELGLGSEFIGWSVSTMENGGNARIQGGEINIVQPLTFLPGWGQYFTIKANGSTLDLSSGDKTRGLPRLHRQDG